MNRVISFFLAGGLLLCGPVIAQAAPLGGLGESPVAEDALVTQVHGYHRSCRWGPHRGWWHRHLRSGRPVHCGRRYYRYGYYDGPYYGGSSLVLRFGHRHHHHRFHRGRRH